MGVWFLLIGMFLINRISMASEDDLDQAQLYMEACAKQELFASVPPLNFSCDQKVAGGYYADMDTGCHIFHLCAPSNLHSLTDHPFCCHPELVFDQRFLVCDRPENVDCPVSHRYFSDQFDGPVKVQQRENEARQSKGNGQVRDHVSDHVSDQASDHVSDQASDNASDHASDHDSVGDHNPGKAVTLPPAFRQR